MIGTDPKLDQFITDHRWAVVSTLRKSGTPSSTFVAYARDGDTLVISTPGYTFKRKSLERDPRVAVCCCTNAEPFNFVTVEGRASVEKDNLVAMTKLVFANIAGTGWTEPEDLQGWLDKQDRVILRIHPEKVYGVIR